MVIQNWKPTLRMWHIPECNTPNGMQAGGRRQRKAMRRVWKDRNGGGIPRVVIAVGM